MDSIDKIEKDLVNFITKESSQSFNKGAQAVIDILRGAMKVSGLDYIPTQWLDTAQKEVDKFKLDYGSE